MRFLRQATLTAAAIALEPAFHGALAGSDWEPNLLLVPFALALLTGPGPSAVLWCAFVGFVADCLSGAALGPQTAAFAIVAAIGSLVIPDRLRTAVEHAAIAFAAILSGVWLAAGLRLLLEAGATPPPLADTTRAAAATAGLIAASGFLLRRLKWLAGGVVKSIGKGLLLRPGGAS
jgi:cell shape-determining protein MreD